MAKKDTTGLYSKFVFFLKYHTTDFYSSFTNFHFKQQYMRVSCSPHFLLNLLSIFLILVILTWIKWISWQFKFAFPLWLRIGNTFKNIFFHLYFFYCKPSIASPLFSFKKFYYYFFLLLTIIFLFLPSTPTMYLLPCFLLKSLAFFSLLLLLMCIFLNT